MESFKNELLSKMEGHLTVDQMSHLKISLTEMQTKYNTIMIDVENTEENKEYNTRLIREFQKAIEIEGKSQHTIKQYTFAITYLMEGVQKRFDKMTADDIRTYLLNYRDEHHVSDRTLENKRAYISAFFSWLYNEGYLYKNPTKQIKPIKVCKKVRTPYTNEEIERMRGACKDLRERAILEFLISTGCRVSEVANVDKECVNIFSGECIVLGKGNKERTVYLNTVAAYHVARYLSVRNDNERALLLNSRGKRLSRRTLEEFINRIAKRAGISNAHPHKFRRTFATDAINKGVPIQSVSHVLGHSSLETTMIYYYEDEAHIKADMRKVC